MDYPHYGTVKRLAKLEQWWVNQKLKLPNYLLMAS